jgi:hypothetical protein
MMAADRATCRFRFQAVPEIFANFPGAARQDPGFQATTLQGLGLDVRLHSFGHSIESNAPQIENQKPWERFKFYVDQLNA